MCHQFQYSPYRTALVSVLSHPLLCYPIVALWVLNKILFLLCDEISFSVIPVLITMSRLLVTLLIFASFAAATFSC
ncbi:hypothetical protein F5051DRAFT_420330 [Lentinula edodes]|nr:hypothetical protein F5051DRAFT_420330 [Lentinula edodes]